MTPTVAVIMPVYNAEATIIEAIGSVERQSFSDFVIIAVDDGSTDDSRVLLNEFAASRDRVVILSHANHGAAYSRNRGIRYAQDHGIPFVAFLDADDVWHEDKLAWQIEAFRIHPDVDLVVTRMDRYENLRGRQRPEPDGHSIAVVGEFFETLCRDDFTFPPASVMIRSHCLDEGLMYDPEFACGEDFLPFLHLAYKGSRLAHVHVPLYFERSLPTSLQRHSSAAYQGYQARVAAIEGLTSSCRTDAAMTPKRLAMLVKARDSYLSGMLYGARRCLPYPQALLVAIRAFAQYRDKRAFLIELAKTTVYPTSRFRALKPR